MTRRLAGLLGALVVATATLVGISAQDAQAAYCGASGVGVVVDFGDLGGGVRTDCGSGSKASAAFQSAGVSLDNDPGGSGMVCRVDSKPAAGQPCTETNAYWALFVSKQGGAWAYASQGVYTQPVSSGDSVAFVWQSSNGRTTPGAAPQQPAPAASAKPSTQAPAPAPSKKATTRSAKRPVTAKASPVPTTAGVTVTPSASPTPTAAGTTSPTGTATPSLSAVATPSPTATTTPTAADSPTAAAEIDAEPAAAEDGGVPGWVPPLIIVVLAGAAGGVAWARRAR